MSENAKISKDFSNKIVYLNFFGAILIMFRHVGVDWAFQDLGLVGEVYNTFVRNLAVFAMSWFFFISPVLMYRDLNFSNLKKKLFSRVKSLFVPYLVWTVFSISLWFFQTVLSRGDFTWVTQEIFNFGFLKRIFIDNEFNGALWYLPKLFLFCLFSPVILLLNRNKYVAFAVCVVSTALNLYLQPDYFSVLFWLPVYFSGALVGRHYLALFQSPPRLFRKKGMPFAVIAAMLMIFATALAFDGWHLLYLLRVSAAPLTVLVFNAMKPFEAPPKWFKYSIFIYFMHSPLMARIFNPVYRRLVFIDGVAGFFVYVITVLIFVVVASVLTGMILEKICKPIYRFVSGGR